MIRIFLVQITETTFLYHERIIKIITRYLRSTRKCEKILIK